MTDAFLLMQLGLISQKGSLRPDCISYCYLLDKIPITVYDSIGPLIKLLTINVFNQTREKDSFCD